MFLGYQNEKIVFIAETREELENLPCVVIDKIEETDKQYFIHNGEFVTEIPEPIEEELQQYLNETDWYAVRYAETGIEIPEEVKQKRQETRDKISALRNDENMV